MDWCDVIRAASAGHEVTGGILYWLEALKNGHHQLQQAVSCSSPASAQVHPTVYEGMSLCLQNSGYQ